MIKLSVEEYCWNCDGFEPVTDKYKSLSDSTMIFIKCENERRCRAIYRHIKNHLEKEQKDGAD